jgi:hypothetical protein
MTTPFIHLFKIDQQLHWSNFWQKYFKMKQPFIHLFIQPRPDFQGLRVRFHRFHFYGWTLSFKFAIYFERLHSAQTKIFSWMNKAFSQSIFNFHSYSIYIERLHSTQIKIFSLIDDPLLTIYHHYSDRHRSISFKKSNIFIHERASSNLVFSLFDRDRTNPSNSNQNIFMNERGPLTEYFKFHSYFWSASSYVIQLNKIFPSIIEVF